MIEDPRRGRVSLRQRNQFRLGTACFLFVVCSQQVSAQTADELVEILRQRAGAVKSLHADVQVAQSRPAGMKEYTGAIRRYERIWLRKHQPEDSAKFLETAKKLEASLPAVTTSYRYWALAPGRIRYEEYDSSPRKKGYKDAPQPVILVFAQDHWESFFPATRIATVDKHRLNDMIRWSDQDAICPPLEIAAGAAVLRSVQFMNESSQYAKLTGQVPWEEFLQLASRCPRSAREESLPGGGPARPVLNLHAIPWNKNGFPLNRVRVWFDPDRKYMPVRMECQSPDDVEQGYNDYLTDFAVEWSEPTELADGVFLSQKCVMHSYNLYPWAEEGTDRDNWHRKSFEVSTAEVRFSKVQVNEPLDASLFKITPPAGTNVVDRVDGYHYLIGSAGEELQKSALQLRDELGNLIPTPPDTPLWREAWLYVVLAVAFLAGLSAFYLRKRWIRGSAV